jgi:hypothetical protein
MKRQGHDLSLRQMSDQDVTNRYSREVLKLKTLNRFGRQSERFLGYPNTLMMNRCKRELERRSLPIPKPTTTIVPDGLFERHDLTFEEKWLYLCLVEICESIPNKQYQTYAATLEEIEQDTHATRPIDPLSLFALADKGLIRLTQTGNEYAIAIVRRNAGK